MGVKVYNKLIRDKIPQIIAASGGKCETEVLSEEMYLVKLEEKLSEELNEYLHSKEPEELADLLEVVEAVAWAKGMDWEQLNATKEAKREKRGGFRERLLLRSVTE